MPKGIYEKKVRSLSERFWPKVKKSEDPTGCWLWIAALNATGYGIINRGRRGYPALAHRVAYEIHRGPIDRDFVLDHLCRVRACVNPDHLEAVPRLVNQRRGIPAQPRALQGRPRSEWVPVDEIAPKHPERLDPDTARKVRKWLRGKSLAEGVPVEWLRVEETDR